MTIRQITLENFRNHVSLRLNPSEKFVIFSGENGAGKTNILEAVSLLAPGRGLRRAALPDMARENGSGFFGIAAEISEDIQIGTGTMPDRPERRKSRVNGATVPTNDLAQWISVLWLTPLMDRLFLEGSSGRRNFLDRLVSALEPAHARNCAKYEKARRERNLLLSAEQRPEPRWIDAIDAQLADAGGEIIVARQRLMTSLNDHLSAQSESVFAIPNLYLEDQNITDAGHFLHILKENRAADQAAGRTLKGPHRCDMRALHRHKQRPAEQCSTGEQKAMLFSIILSHAKLVENNRNIRPILLLDEMAAHLDPKRRAALFDRLDQSGSQIWLTGTEAELFSEIHAISAHYHLNNGSVNIITS